MKSWSEDNQPKVGLRERKMARTKAAIQRHALRLFHEHGYGGTTIEKIAEEAEVSPSTVYRYFPTKEDIVLEDDLDPLILASFQAQPPELSPLHAMRNALRELFTGLSAEDMAIIRDRAALTLSVPEVRAAMLNQYAEVAGSIAEAVAKRVGRPADDFSVRNFAGALVGTLFSIALMANDEQADYIELLDASLAHLEAGLPL